MAGPSFPTQSSKKTTLGQGDNPKLENAEGIGRDVDGIGRAGRDMEMPTFFRVESPIFSPDIESDHCAIFRPKIVREMPMIYRFFDFSSKP